ncbi:hypothetical protein RRG08_011891 [Elysia crispata]|uniref:Uncharacterized protein n=1 Tax=Elysia crispata TaxID=231223 RepID=A0AAE0ZMH1_9GAST|nr:hypothetical protein RRG08_011891 [Elysia crispata]
MYHRHSLLKSSEERFRYKKMTSNFGRDKESPHKKTSSKRLENNKKKKPVYFKVELFGYAKIATITNRKTKHSSEISGLLQLTSLKPGAGEDVGTHWPYRWLAITGQPTFMMDTVSVTTKTHAALQ